MSGPPSNKTNFDVHASAEGTPCAAAVGEEGSDGTALSVLAGGAAAEERR